MEGHSGTLLDGSHLCLQIQPDLFLHHVVHQLVDFAWHHRDVIISGQLAILLPLDAKRLLDCRYNWVLHQVKLLLDDASVL